MIQIRNNCFETNSSSSHSITLSPIQICQSKDLPLDSDGYVTVAVDGFCSTDLFCEPIDKLGYVMQVYAAKNHICLNNSPVSQEFKIAVEELYKTEEFQALQSRIVEVVGPSCKGIRFDTNCGWGYIDDSYDAVEEFCCAGAYDPVEFIFNDYILHYEYDG